MSSGRTVGIIGAGIGGLMAGAYLAKAGYRVEVLERAATVGGNAGWYVRAGHRYPTGATLAFGLEEGGPLRTLLNRLDIPLKAESLEYPMDVVLPDRTIRIVRDAQAWEEELRRGFPERSKDVVACWRALSKLADATLAVTQAEIAMPLRNPDDALRLLGFTMRSPRYTLRLLRSGMRTVEQLLQSYRLADYMPFRQWLNAQLIDAAQTDVSGAALLPASVALDIYRRGSFAIEGGMAGLAEALVKAIERFGGQVLTGSAVNLHNIQWEESVGRWHVESRKGSGCYDILVHSAGVPISQDEDLDAGETQWGAFRVDALLPREEALQFGHPQLERLETPFALQIVPNKETASLFGDEHGPVYITLQQALDSAGQLIPDEVMLTASVHTETERWTSCSQEEYMERKALALEAVLREGERVLPGLRSKLLRVEAGSPRTYQRYVGKAAVGGTPLTVRNAIIRPRGLGNRWRRLYYAGERVFPGPGTLSSALSGYYAARAIQREQP